MKIIFAQGNPGSRYAQTRHNVGFSFLDFFAAQANLSFAKKPKFQSDIAEGIINGEKILLVKPNTFYNETGIAARLLCDFYKLDSTQDFLVIHDDLALPLGTIRTRKEGSDAGNNGVKSLNAHLGMHYHRIRIGIYTIQRDYSNDIDFVIGAFSETEKNTFPLLFEQTAKFTAAFIDGAMPLTKVNVLIPPKE